MKVFLKILIAVLFLTLAQPAFCQKLPQFHDWYTNKELRKNYPEYTNYFEEYTSRLYDNLKIKENFPWYATLGIELDYTINKDGSISDFIIYTACDEYLEYINKYIHPIDYYSLIKYSRRYEEYVKKIIYQNPPKPFPKEIEYEKMKIELEVMVEPKSKKERYYAHKAYNNYFHINKNNDECIYNINGGNTTSYNTLKKTYKFIPPTWDIKILLYR